MSMTRDDKIKCDECGRFIGVQDLIDGKALHQFVLPDSEFSDETFESLCARCWTPPLASQHGAPSDAQFNADLADDAAMTSTEGKSHG